MLRKLIVDSILNRIKTPSRAGLIRRFYFFGFAQVLRTLNMCFPFVELINAVAAGSAVLCPGLMGTGTTGEGTGMGVLCHISFPGEWEVAAVPSTGCTLSGDTDSPYPYPCLGQVLGSKMASAHFPCRLNSPSGAEQCPLFYKAPSFMRCNSLFTDTHHFITKLLLKRRHRHGLHIDLHNK